MQNISGINRFAGLQFDEDLQISRDVGIWSIRKECKFRKSTNDVL